VLSNLAAAAELGTEAHAALLRVRALFEPTAPGRAFEALPTVEVSAHDRVQIDGPPGSGKSTLAARLAGLADAGDRDPAPGSARVALAPQPHHNAVFAGTLAFNLLAGPRWPASPADLEDARAVCHALGLGPLLERMPAGLGQIVGDMGWRLSHGERARLFIARALLQGCETLVLDDALGALDPESRLQVLGEVRRRARRLVLVAPP
jgi:ATP-binding cassette subfamily B protein